MSEHERWTIGRLLQWTTDYLKKSGSTSPRLDAEVLLSDARGCERIQLYTAFDEEPGDAVRNRFRDLVKRRAAGEPVAYLVGRREFYSLTFHVTPDVLIPRPETEFLVLGVLDAVKQLGITDRLVEVADVGTGSGAVAVSVAKHAANCHITAIDLNAQSLSVARKNAEQHDVADRIEFLVSDLLAEVPVPQRFDILASNPPYVAQTEMAKLSREVRDYEPRTALLGGVDGMEVISRLVAEATQRLVPGGWLLMEIGPTVEAKVLELVKADPGWIDLTVLKDLAGLPRVVKVRRVGDL